MAFVQLKHFLCLIVGYGFGQPGICSMHNQGTHSAQCPPLKLGMHHNLKIYGTAKCKCRKEICHLNIVPKMRIVGLGNSCRTACTSQ